MSKQYTLMPDGSSPTQTSETFTEYDPDEPVTGARIGETVYFDERAPWTEDAPEAPAVKHTRTVRTGTLAIIVALIFAVVNLGMESLIPTHWYVWSAASPIWILATYVWLVRRVSSSS